MMRNESPEQRSGPDDRSMGSDRERRSLWFCPACARPRHSMSGLCPECGDSLRRQGYCAVCEDHWSLSAGDLCPKHDIPLASERPESGPVFDLDEPVDWVTVRSYGLPFEAEAARLRLDAEGIPAILDGLRMGINYPNQTAIGGIRLQVPRSMEQDARILLSQSWAAPFDDEDDEELDWDEIAPPRDANDWRVSLLFWGVVLSILVVLAGLIGISTD